MSWLNRITRWLEPFAISNITLYIIIGQVFVYCLLLMGRIQAEDLVLVPAWVRGGEYWRLFTFLFMPAAGHWALAAFAFYLLFLMGSALESYWGVVKYNLFLLTGFLLTVGLAFFATDSATTNIFIGGSIFLAFAYLNPDFVMYIFFILPVKIKWLALITWVGYAWAFFTEGWVTKLNIIAAVGNFLLFFGRDLVLDIKLGRRRMSAQAKKFARSNAPDEPRHRCHVCGKTDLTNPEMDFRYCSKCAGDQCYCPEHIRNHEHVLTEEPLKK